MTLATTFHSSHKSLGDDMKQINIQNKKFGNLFVVSKANNIGRFTAWNCLCDCGESVVVRTGGLTSGNTKSCGCLRKKVSETNFTKHGHKTNRKPSPEYTSWSLMRDRCNNKNNKNYYRYGGRGISVCEQWVDFNNFYKDMGNRPVGTTLERIDSNKNYCPENCCWATRKQQSRNRDYCKTVIFEGKSEKLFELAERFGIDLQLVHQRLSRGWTVDRAIKQTPRSR